MTSAKKPRAPAAAKSKAVLADPGEAGATMARAVYGPETVVLQRSKSKAF